MTSEQKMRIIHRWCDDLILRDTYDNKVFGMIWRANTRTTTPYCDTRDKAINAAYYLVREYAWEAANDL